MSSIRSIYDAKVADGFRRDPAQEALVERLEALRRELQRPTGGLTQLLSRRISPRGIYVWGDVGRGKSMLVDSLLTALPDVSGRRAHFHAFMRDIHQALHDARAGGKTDPLKTAADEVTRGLDLLALDEVEITDLVDAMIVGRVFERVLQRGVVLVATSNRAPSELYRDGLKRDLFLPFVRLLESETDVFHLDSGQDYRRDTALVRELYLTPENGHAAKQMENLWERLPVGPEDYTDLGSRAKLRRKGDAVRTSFDVLCHGSFAASDFLDLAQIAAVVVLDDVPRLSERDHDAVRRFILLVDALYDARRGLIISAAGDPEDLYSKGGFATEFRRTVSRLYEMNHPSWPGRPTLR